MRISEEEASHLKLLRQRAEEVLRGKPIALGDLSSEDIHYLMHELQVHQAELSLQNEELRQVQLELEISRDEYSDLYNFAPAGYCTINRKDRILEANQTLAVLLGIELTRLLNEHLSHFVAREDQDKFYLHRQRAFETRKSNVGEIQMVTQVGERLYVRIETRIAHSHEDQLLVMVSDITKQRELQRRVVEQREQERLKTAHFLQDGPVQALAAINFALRSILLDHPSPELAKSVEAIQDDVREQIQMLRSYAVDLRPPLLTQLGLEKGLHSYLEGFREKHITLVVRMDIRPIGTPLPETVSVALFRICQEALTNISKHALSSTTEVTVKLRKERHQVRLEIQDNGEGYDLPDQWLDFALDGRLGILGMREQAEAVGGQLGIVSNKGIGTLVWVKIPLNTKPADCDPP